jgi:hypothetical protein
MKRGDRGNVTLVFCQRAAKRACDCGSRTKGPTDLEIRGWRSARPPELFSLDCAEQSSANPSFVAWPSWPCPDTGRDARATAPRRITPRLKSESGRSRLRIPAPLDGSAVPENVGRRNPPRLDAQNVSRSLELCSRKIGNIVPRPHGDVPIPQAKSQFRFGL